MEPKQAMLAEYTLTVPEAAVLLGETEKAVHHLIYTARLDAIRVQVGQGHEFRMRPSDVLAQKAQLERGVNPVAYPVAVATAPKRDGGPALRGYPARGDAASRGPERPAGGGPAAQSLPPPVACCQADWVGVYRDLFVCYDRLGRRAARLERENHVLRQTLREMKTRVTPGEAGPAGPLGGV
jgi:hypothetical protein